MADNEYKTISTNQLDMNAVTDYVIAKGKLVYRTDAANANATDVDKVNGIASNQIAQSIDTTHRDTVKNALQLNGKAAADYMTKVEGGNIATTTGNIQTKYGSELRDMRDELYQMKNQLAKNGFIRNDGQYAGYHDLFKKNNIVHEADKLCTASAQTVSGLNKIQITDAAVFAVLSVHDYIALKNTALNESCVRQIVEKDKDGITIVLDRDVEQRFQAVSYDIYKSAGIVYDGSFEFANPPANQVGSNEFYSGLSDDSFNVYQKLGTVNSGFGYGFKIPDGKSGFLADIEICMRAYNSPGAAMCYVIDERDVDKFRSPDQMEADYILAKQNNNDTIHFFAKSQPLTLQASAGKRYCKFNFKNASTDTYPLLPQPKTNETIRYVMIVELLKGDSANYYDLLFLQHRNSDGTKTDLQLNNTTYTYKRQAIDSGISGLMTNSDIDSYDLFYQAHTLENNEKEPSANMDGLYSSIIYRQPVLGANHARVTMRIKREGSYAVDTAVSPVGVKAKPIVLVNQEPLSGIRMVEDLSLKTNLTKPVDLRNGESDISQVVPIVVGDTVTTVDGISEASITANDAMIVYKGDPVYRVGYYVFIKAANMTLDQASGTVSIADQKRFYVPIKKVIRDVERENNEVSDRIIFETDLGADLKDYNYFELQVYWENKQMSSYPDVKKSQMGAIKELTVSFDKNV